MLPGRPALYNAYGQDEKLKALFATGSNAWNVAKLAESLAEQASGTVPRMENDEYSEMPKGDDTVLQAKKSFFGVKELIMMRFPKSFPKRTFF